MTGLWRRGRYGATRYLWVDVASMGYMAGAGALQLVLGFGTPGWLTVVLLHLGYVVLGLEVVRASQLRPDKRLLLELRTWYPAFVILYGFFSATRLQSLMSDDQFWATNLLADIDHALFGVHPTVWLQQFHRPWLDELFSFLNLSYYLIPFLYAVPLVIAGRRETVWAGTSIALFTYVVNYTLFLFLPALGPRMIPAIEALRPSELHGGPFVWLVQLVQGEHGTVRGAAFPSVHVSAAIAWAMVAWHYERRIALAVWPLAIGTTLSTVYLGLHHAIDPLAGLVLGVICYGLGRRILRARGEDPSASPIEDPSASPIEHTSADPVASASSVAAASARPAT
ncbi:MAG TPA: phosphatase PAP2 family protein [Kofleriaceae bacterium]|nr:phosphatase PAP2 family protein [Kofleriaceae bacterium]